MLSLIMIITLCWNIGASAYAVPMDMCDEDTSADSVEAVLTEEESEAQADPESLYPEIDADETETEAEVETDAEYKADVEAEVGAEPDSGDKEPYKTIRLDLSSKVMAFGGFPEDIDDEPSGDDPHILLGSAQNEDIFDLLEKAFDDHESEIDISAYGYSAQEAENTLVDFLNDYDYAFNVESISLTLDPENDEVCLLNVTQSADASERTKKFEFAVSEIISGVDPAWSDYAKLLYLHDKLCETNEYDYSYSNYSAYNAIVDHTSVCQGYAAAYSILAERVGIDVECVRGTVNGANGMEPHAWNRYLENGYAYYIDCTWDDQPLIYDDICWKTCKYNHFMISFEHTYERHGMDSQVWYDYHASIPSDEKYEYLSDYGLDYFDGSYMIYHKAVSLSSNAFIKLDLHTFSETKLIEGRIPDMTSDGNLYYYSDYKNIYSINMDGSERNTLVSLDDEAIESIYYLKPEGTKLKYLIRSGFTGDRTEELDLSALTGGANSITLLTEEVAFAKAGDKMQILRSVSPSSAYITWKSSNPDVVSVSDGVLTCKGPGTALITASSGNVTAYCHAYLDTTVQDEYEYSYGFIETDIYSDVRFTKAKTKKEIHSIPAKIVENGVEYPVSASFSSDENIKNVLCEKGTRIGLQGFGFGYCKNLESVDFDGVQYYDAAAESIGLNYWFCNDPQLTRVSFKGAKLPPVTDLCGAFTNCPKLKVIDFSGLRFDKLEYAQASGGYKSTIVFNGSDNIEKIYTPATVSSTVSIPIPEMYEYKDGEYGDIAYTDLCKAPVNSVLAKKKPKCDLSAVSEMSSITVGGSTRIIVSGAKGDVSYTSLAPGVATVDDDGNIRGISVGEASIKIVSAETDGYMETEASIKINVVEPSAARPPEADIPAGEVCAGTKVVLTSATPGADIYYTIDGSVPTSASAKYSEPIIINRSPLTIKAFAEKAPFKDSDVITLTYTIKADWGDISGTSLRALFSNNVTDVPSGIWYAFGSEEAGYTYMTEYSVYNGASVMSLAYDGNKLTFNDRISVFHGTRKLSENTEYTVKYANNLHAADENSKKPPKVIITGKGNYKENASFNFEITKASLSDKAKVILASESETVINGGSRLGSVKPAVTFNGKKLVSGRDYTIEYYKVISGDKTLAGGNEKAVPGEEYHITITATENGDFENRYESIAKIKAVDKKDKKTVKIASLKVNRIKIDYTGDVTDINSVFDNSDESLHPLAVIKNGNVPLVYNKDYTVTLDGSTDHRSSGKHTFIIKGTADPERQYSYIGTKRVEYEIAAVSMKNVRIAGLSTSVEYCGRAFGIDDLYKRDGIISDSGFEDKVTLYVTEKRDGVKIKKALKYPQDYTYKMNNTGCVGKFDLVFTGTGAYCGTIKKTINVKAYDLKKDTDNKIVITVSDAVYSASGSKPEVCVTFGGKRLAEGIDYKLSYKNNTAASDDPDIPESKRPQVILTGKGNFTGKNTGNCFLVKKSDASKCISVSSDDKAYKAKAGKGYFKSVPKLSDNGSAVKTGKGKDIEPLSKDDYRYYYAETGSEIRDNAVLPEGTVVEVHVTVTCGEKSSYREGTYDLVGYYRILGKDRDIKNASVSINYTNSISFSNGMKIIPVKDEDIVVKIRKKRLTCDDYDITSLKNNSLLGTAVVTIRGRGEYGGSKKVTFLIKNRSLKY